MLSLNVILYFHDFKIITWSSIYNKNKNSSCVYNRLLKRVSPCNLCDAGHRFATTYTNKTPHLPCCIHYSFFFINSCYIMNHQYYDSATNAKYLFINAVATLLTHYYTPAKQHNKRYRCSPVMRFPSREQM